MTTPSPTAPITLLPCPFCGEGETLFRENTHWTGMRSAVISVTLQHWCKGVAGVNRSAIQFGRKTHEEVVAAWNLRAPLAPAPASGDSSSRAGEAQRDSRPDSEREANERRYLWLRDIAPQNFPWGPYVVGCPSGAALDAEIDAAISAAQGKCK